jgi:hypothetical protein
VDVKRTFLSKDMSKQIEFNVEYSPKHELAAEKAVAKPGSFEITSESIRTVQNVGGFVFNSHWRVAQVDRRSRCRDFSNVFEFLDRVVSSKADENHRDLSRTDSSGRTVREHR